MASEANVAERVLTSIELVDREVDWQLEAIGELLVRPELTIVTTRGDDPVIGTYFRSKANHAQKVGIGFSPDAYDDEDAALRGIRRYNDDQCTHAIVVQLPLLNGARTQELCDAVVDIKDVDALSAAGREFYPPPTAKATVELARHHTNKFDGIAKNRVAVVGSNGRLVGSDAVALLRDEGFDPIEIDTHNTHLIRRLGRDADLVITATGRPGIITKDDLDRPTRSDIPLVIIDGGIGVGEGGKPAQDLHPDVFELEYVLATKRMRAVGPLAVAYMFHNVIEATEQQLALPGR